VLINLSYPVGSTSEPRAFEGGHQGCETKRTAAATAEEGKEEGEEKLRIFVEELFFLISASLLRVTPTSTWKPS